jgi:glucose-6-phosphate isomerase
MDFFYTHNDIPKKRLRSIIHRLDGYTGRLRAVQKSKTYRVSESPLSLPSDTRLLNNVLRIIRAKTTSRLKYIVVIGIGGSSLGAKAIYHALRGYADALSHNRFPQMFFLDATDPEYLDAFLKFLKISVRHPEEILIHIASKSGTSTEVIVNAEIVLSALKKFPSFMEHVIVTTDAGSPLARTAKEHNIAWIPIPESVGGRFSVFSPVGLIPLATAGIDIRALLRGARSMIRLCLDSSVRSPAAISAATLFHHARAGKAIHDTFFFHTELQYLGDWYRQLLAESIGKEKNRRGKTVHAGITPTTSIGSTDLHSIAQLTLGGPRDKITTFVSTKKHTTHVRVPKKKILSPLPYLHGKSVEEILHAIYTGTIQSYTKHGLPFLEVLLPDISESSLGAFMQWKMIEVMLLGKLMGVDAFDEPNVEDYKEKTRRILSA